MDIKFKDNSQLRISLFTQLEYIESTGTQYIDTGISFSNGFRSVAKLYPTNVSSYKTFAGAYRPNLHNIHRIKDGSWNPCTQNNSTNLYGTVDVNTLYTVDMSNANSKYNLIVNGSTLANNVSTPTGYSSLTCWLFALHRTDDTDYLYYYGRIYEISLYDENNVLKFHGIPALDSHSVVCMYDTVSKQFFYNQGTGDFIAGPKVPSTTTRLPDNILLKTTTFYHKNTPNVDGLGLLNGILNAQETAEDVVLNRIRVDIGNVSGSLSELMQYAGMSGFNDNYEPQAKPRLVGAYTINDWYTQEQLAAAQAAFDGLTIVPDPNYVIDFSQLAVQTLDDTQPNYNPAVAIILQSGGLGVTLDKAPVAGKEGRWFITKSQAASDGSIPSFSNKSNIPDSSLIVANTIASYELYSFNEFQFFSRVTSVNFERSSIKEFTCNSAMTNVKVFDYCHLTKLVLNENTRNIGSYWSDWYNSSIDTLYCCSLEQLHLLKWESSNKNYVPSINHIIINNTEVLEYTVTSEEPNVYVYSNNFTKIITNDSTTNIKIPKNQKIKTVGLLGSGADLELGNSITSLSLDSCPITSMVLPDSIVSIGLLSRLNASVTFGVNVTSIPDNCFGSIDGDKILEFLGEVTYVGYLAFYHVSVVVHLAGSRVPAWANLNEAGYMRAPRYKVGDGSSAEHDNAILQAYLADAKWSTISSRLDTWYNYLHPSA